MKYSLLLSLVLSLNCVFELTCSQSNGPIVKTDRGLIQGIKQSIDGVTINSYLGIPYALPPIGPRRYERPVEIRKPFTDIFPAKSFGNACEQNFIDAQEETPGFKLSENCLFLNIWTPEDASVDKLYPVFVNIHGANYTFGSAGAEDTRCDYLTVYTNIVTVNMNYRLGALGYSYGGTDQIVGNAGVHDIVLAANWIRSNIRGFGGDPERVTMTGLSSGSIILSSIFLTPTIPTDWFNRIVFMSGVAVEDITIKSVTDTFKVTKRLSKTLNCSEYSTLNDTFNIDELTCLKIVPGITIAQTKENELYQAAYGDKYIFPTPPRDLINSRKFPSGFKIMVGTETDEAYLGRNMKTRNVTEAIHKLSAFLQRLKITTIADAKKLVERYFVGIGEHDVEKIRKRVISFLSNMQFQCPSLLYSIAFAQNKANTIYSYRNNYVSAYGRAEGRPFGAKHTDDFSMFIGLPFRHRDRYDDKDREVSLFMMKVLADFVKGNEPFWPSIQVNGSRTDEIALPRWEIKNNSTLTNVDFDTDKDICLLWAKYLKLNV